MGLEIMANIDFRPGLALGCFSLFLLGVEPSSKAAETGVFVDVKESDASDARVVERWKLYGSSHALVIGIDDYTGGWPKLRNAVRDARSIADELERHGFQVTLKTDLDARELRDTLRAFYVLRGADPEARLLLWFAGHGHSIDDEGFLVPADAPLPTDPRFKIKALHMRDFGGLIRLSQSKHVLSVFDSCFSGTIFTARAGPAFANISRKTKRPVRQFITSGDAGQQVRDDGSFRKLFIRAIRGEDRADANADGYVTGDELGLYLSQRVTNLTNGAQTPRYGRLQDVNFDQGDFVFVLPKKQSVPVSTAVQGNESVAKPDDPSEAALDLAFWNAIKDTNDPARFQAYLKSFPSGRFAPLARLNAGPPSAAESDREPDREQAARMTGIEPKTEPQQDSTMETASDTQPRLPDTEAVAALPDTQASGDPSKWDGEWDAHDGLWALNFKIRGGKVTVRARFGGKTLNGEGKIDSSGEVKAWAFRPSLAVHDFFGKMPRISMRGSGILGDVDFVLEKKE